MFGESRRGEDLVCAGAQEINEFSLKANSPLERVVRKVQIVQIPGLADFL